MLIPFALQRSCLKTASLALQENDDLSYRLLRGTVCTCSSNLAYKMFVSNVTWETKGGLHKGPNWYGNLNCRKEQRPAFGGLEPIWKS